MRDQVAALRALLALSMAMITADDETEIVRLATAAIPSVGDSRTVAVRLGGVWLPEPSGLPDADAVAAELGGLGRSGGTFRLARAGWSWAFPLAGLGGMLGHLLVEADAEPAQHEMFLLGLLAQHTATALVNARLHRQEQATSARDRALADELGAMNLALERAADEAERARAAAQGRLDIHQRLTRAVAEGAAEEGIAVTVHDLTGRPVAIEDRFGTLIAWAGPDRPDRYPKDPSPEREKLLLAGLSTSRPLRHQDRLLAVVRASGEALGLIALVDPRGTASDLDEVALKHAATVLALELTRRRSVAETELRLGGNLVGDLLAGRNLDGILDRCRAAGYDLDRPHRVVVVEGAGHTGDGDALLKAVRRAARTLGVGSLTLAQERRTALLAAADPDWSAFRAAVLAEVGSGGWCRIGVGGTCTTPAEFARSHREAQLGLHVQASLGGPDQVASYDDLGVYRLLSEGADASSMWRFVRRWLGELLDYDAAKHADLVSTLRRYLDSGGNYDSTASVLSIHRSTLRYRLRRIREISGHDLTAPETRFNLQLATRALTTIDALRAAR